LTYNLKISISSSRSDPEGPK